MGEITIPALRAGMVISPDFSDTSGLCCAGGTLYLMNKPVTHNSSMPAVTPAKVVKGMAYLASV